MTQRPKLIALPQGPTPSLTPKLWLAIGLIAYNHHLMTLQPLRVLTPRGAGRRSPAALLSTEGLTLETRIAIREIARTLLAPLGLSVSTQRRTTAPGARAEHYILVEDRESIREAPQERIA
jgi:hypothetical protein